MARRCDSWKIQIALRLSTTFEGIMISCKMPDTDGYYWITEAELDTDQPDENAEWYMAYIKVEGREVEQIRLHILVFPDNSRDELQESVWWHTGNRFRKWRSDDGQCWTGPTWWVGPINAPGGPFGGPICEIDIATFLRAQATESDCYIKHRVHHGGGSITIVGIDDQDDEQR